MAQYWLQIVAHFALQFNTAIKEISHDVRPKTFGEYLVLNNDVQIIDIEKYDIDIACTFLDNAYDFTPHKLRQAARPANPRQQGGFSQ